LLPRFYDISSGKIKINGINYLDYDLKSLRDNISYVFQEPVIFNMSILDNIKYGSKRKITRDEVVDVCKKIGLHDKISSLEKGYDTLINIYTDKISYGEKQLLNFARAILKNSGILIMDEVTSNLDLEFEQKVMKATREVLKNKFSFIIAHRLKTIKNADIIIYIKDGVIKELGTHDELIKKNGYYKELYYSKKIENKE
jgi:ABC-type multidrug transport system fused ATPase/permease subunit